MIGDKNQKQAGGDSSVNLQAQNIIINTGASPEQVREIVNEVFKENFIKMRSDAAEIAKARAQEITEKVLDKIKDAEHLLNEFKKPGMQDSFFNAQKEYAKSGDKNLADLLVDVLVDRANQTDRNVMQIILDESIHIASKLTAGHFDILTLSFLLTMVMSKGVRSVESLEEYITKTLLPFSEELKQEGHKYKYLEFVGCGHARAGSHGSLEKRIATTYQGLFQKGKTMEELKAELGDADFNDSFFVPSIHEESKIQIGFLNKEEMNMALKGMKTYSVRKIKSVFEATTFSDSEVNQFLAKRVPEMGKLFSEWRTTPLEHFELTDVGIVIAHANFRRKTGQTLDLGLWIK